MFKKIIQYFSNRKSLKASKKYYQLVAEGGLFLKFVQQDLDKMKKNALNRTQRRRFIREIEEDGKFSPEMVNYYYQQIDKILHYIELNSKETKCTTLLSKLVKKFTSFKTTK